MAPPAAAAAAAAAKMDRVLIRDTDHLAHFAADLSAARASRQFADVVLHCAPADPAPEKPKSRSARTAYPTLRVHRAVLGAISDFLAALLAPLPLEEDIHLTLDATPLQVAEKIVEFAYAGEVRIAKPLVSTVCDAAHRLQVKFLKDSFVKITDKDYAAVKAGKKTLASLKADATTGADKAETPKKGGQVGKGGGSKSGKSSSDTDSAESGDEVKKNAGKKGAAKGKGSAKGKEQKKGAAAKKGGAAPGNVIFTVLKPKDGSSANAVPNDGRFLVFNKGGQQQPVLPRGAVTTSAQRIVTTAAPLPTSSLPSPLASIKNPLPPAALPRVKKVMIPPTASMLHPGQKVALPGGSPPPAVIALPKGITPTKPTAALAGPTSPQKVVSLNAFQLQTIRQPDGTEIQVLKQPSGHIMKQLKSTKSPPPIQLPTQPVAVSGVQRPGGGGGGHPALPTSPITVVKTADGKLVTTSGTPLRAMAAAGVPAGAIFAAPPPPPPRALAGKQGGARGRGGKQQASKVPSRLPPKDALAIAMEAIVGKQGAAGVPGPGPGRAPAVALPNSPIPVSEILSPGAKAVMPSKPIPSAVVKSVTRRATPNVAVVSPPGYGVPRGQQRILVNATGGARLGGTSMATTALPPVPLPTVPSPVISAARHSLSQSKLAIPSTVPDDFLMTDDSSENGNGGDKQQAQANGKKEESQREGPSRSSGRVRKQNKKYAGEGDKEAESVANGAAANAKPTRSTRSDVKALVPISSTASRKRKADSDNGAPTAKKAAAASATNSKVGGRGAGNRRAAAVAASKKTATATPSTSARQRSKVVTEKEKQLTPVSSTRKGATGKKVTPAASAATPASSSRGKKATPVPRGAAAIAAVAPGYSSSGRKLRKRL